MWVLAAMTRLASPGLRAAGAVGKGAQSALQAFPSRPMTLQASRMQRRAPLLAQPAALQGLRRVMAPLRIYSTDYSTSSVDLEEVDFDASMANLVRLVGVTGKDLEVRTFEWGKNGQVPLAVEWRKGGKRSDDKETHWYEVEMYGPLVERLDGMLKKGTKVLVEGRLKQNKWVDKQGMNRTTVKVVASSVKKVRRSPMGQADPGLTQEQQQQWEQAISQPAAASAGSGGGEVQATQEELWMELFQSPHNWIDHRQEKEAGSKSPKFPDFKRKSDGAALWITSRGTPAWVAVELPNLGQS